MTLFDEFVAVFGVWKEVLPYIDLMVDEREMELVVHLKDRSLTMEQVADRLEMTHEQASDFLQRCYSRHIVDKTVETDVTTYSAGDFCKRLEHFAKFENWDDIPAQDRQAIDRRFLDAFIAKHRPNVELKMQGLAAENALPNDTIMLLHEVEDMIDAAEHIIVQPCDCRRLGQYCDKPTNVCIWLADGALQALDRGYGTRLTREEAKELVRWADKKGLMHTADSEWQTRGLHAICNCCACDCYPFRAAEELGSKEVWPKSRYVAAHDREQCNLCGACVKRCHFEAFFFDDTTIEIDGQARPNVVFDPEKCWGCGLCASTCPSGAIAMISLDTE